MAETRSIDEVYEELMAEFYQIDADKEAARKANKKGKQMVEDRGRGSDSLPSCLDVQKPLLEGGKNKLYTKEIVTSLALIENPTLKSSGSPTQHRI
ncbi:hypothetical protein Tco_1051361 [Tanacetum coccineum]